METVHLIYPHGARISAPDAIGRNLGQRLEKQYQVLYYNIEDPRSIQPGPHDILLGHASPSPFTVLRRSLKHPGWQRVILMSPFSHGDLGNNAFIDHFIERCDLYLAITGNYWYRTTPDSVFSLWFPKMIQLDMAVNRRDFPVIKTRFNPPGQRSFVYIGVDTAQKNLGYLNQIAGQFPETRFSCIGPKRAYSNLKCLGTMDFTTPQAQTIVREHDFLITVGRSDANPTTVLEAMSWGLIPVCTEQSGYTNYPGIINIPLNALDQSVSILHRLQECPEAVLKEMQQVNWMALDEYFNWDRFANQVIAAIESDVSPPIRRAPLRRRLYIRWMELLSSYAVWRRPRYLSRILFYAIRQLFRRLL